MSRFVPRKGQHRVIEAAARLGDRGHDVEVLLVGRGRKEDSLRSQAARSGVPVRFAIDVAWEELPSLYRSMNIFAVPVESRWLGLEVEGLGLVFLEAAASGLPVVAGHSGGSSETVVPGVTGFVSHGLEDLVAALDLLLSDLERAAEMGRAGRERVVREFTWDVVVERFNEGFAAAGAAVRGD